TLSSVAGCDSIITTNLTVASLPLTTEATLVSQTIELKKGYNIVSTYVIAANSTIDFVTKPLSDKGYLVKVQDENGNSFENWGNLGGWMNKVGSIEKTEGYKIQVTENCTLTITGRPVALPLDIPLNAGWNIISFPQTTMLDAMSIMQSLIDQNKLIKVQDEVGNSIEDWGVYGGWKNGIGNFQPGKAYKVKMSSDAVLTLKENYTKGVTIQPTTEKTSYFMSKVEGNGSDHMNINITGMSKSGISAGDELAAFDGEICVGTLKVTEDHIFNGIASLVASNSSDFKNQDGFKAGHEIKVYAWNHATGDESLVSVEAITGQLVYEKNASILIRTKAQTTSVNALTDLVKVDVFPNPSVGRITVRFAQLPDAGSRIDILDLSGRKVTSRIISETSEEINLAQQPSGIYLVKCVIGSQDIIQKLIINH
ncbi:MAG: T9SS type A sorting domain-containing protein, partial [Prolixibacteraceae bacterium]|nr:T9SS type A sorting domain-containing protein [Prolixibacteraceae bacterium]